MPWGADAATDRCWLGITHRRTGGFGVAVRGPNDEKVDVSKLACAG